MLQLIFLLQALVHQADVFRIYPEDTASVCVEIFLYFIQIEKPDIFLSQKTKRSKFSLLFSLW